MKPKHPSGPRATGRDSGAQSGGIVLDFIACKVERERRATVRMNAEAAPLSPSRFARELWGEPRMNLSNEALIAEAVACNHKQVARRRTRDEYETILRHWSVFCQGQGATFYSAQRKHVLLFLAHMEEPGGAVSRTCDWCVDRGCPVGRKREAFSPSYRKKHLAALRFLYWHFACDETLPNLDPAKAVKSPRVTPEHQYTPSPEEVRKLLAARGKPRDRLLAHLLYYAPTRREPVSRMRWRDVDLAAGVWRLVGKGDRYDEFALHPVLLSVLRGYARAQAREAERNPLVRAALENDETAFVFLTRNGRPVRPESLAKMLKWRAIRAGVAVTEARGRWDAPGSKTSRVCPHSLRRAWATHAYNDPDDPVSLDDIADVLRHADTRTTRQHYIRSKPDRAQRALLSRRV